MYKKEIKSYTTKQEQYHDLKLHLQGLIYGEEDLIANLANASALLADTLQDINWAGFYLLKKGELVLGPFQGLPACIRIKVGQGVCGTAVEKDLPMVVDNVEEFPGHIACDANSKSEIVIPLHHEGKVVGVLDIDAPIVSRFDSQDLEGLLSFTKILESCFT